MQIHNKKEKSSSEGLVYTFIDCKCIIHISKHTNKLRVPAIFRNAVMVSESINLEPMYTVVQPLYALILNFGPMLNLQADQLL